MSVQNPNHSGLAQHNKKVVDRFKQWLITSNLYQNPKIKTKPKKKKKGENYLQSEDLVNNNNNNNISVDFLGEQSSNLRQATICIASTSLFIIIVTTAAQLAPVPNTAVHVQAQPSIPSLGPAHIPGPALGPLSGPPHLPDRAGSAHVHPGPRPPRAGGPPPPAGVLPPRVAPGTRRRARLPHRRRLRPAAGRRAG